MEQKLSRLPAMIVTAVLAVAAYILRSHQLKTMFDEIGVIGGGYGGLFTWVTLAAIVLFALYAWKLRPRKKYAAVSSRYLPLMAVSCAAAVLLGLSGILGLVRMQQKVDLVISVGSILTAACWVGVTVCRYQAKRAHGALLLIPAIFYVVDLICQFRLWTRDPVILDYCYDLGALICTMCALFHLAGYSFDQGNRRITTFFCLAGVFFNAASMAGASAADFLGYLAVTLWLLSTLWLLLRPAGKKAPVVEQGPVVEEETAPAEDADN